MLLNNISAKQHLRLRSQAQSYILITKNTTDSLCVSYVVLQSEHILTQNQS